MSDRIAGCTAAGSWPRSAAARQRRKNCSPWRSGMGKHVRRMKIGRHLREISVAAAYGCCCWCWRRLRPDFFSTGQFWKTLGFSAPVLVAAVGMTLVILAREIDISIGWQFSVQRDRGAVCCSPRLPDAAGGGGRDRRRQRLAAVNGVLVAGLRTALDRRDTGDDDDSPRIARLDSQRRASSQSVGRLSMVRLQPGTGERVIGRHRDRRVALSSMLAMRYCGPAGPSMQPAQTKKRPGWRACGRGAVVFSVFVLMGALTGLRRC